MKYKDFYRELIIQESYKGNCVDLAGEDNHNDGVEWMLRVLGDEDNIIRIDEITFFRYINKNEVPRKALMGSDVEYYYIENGNGFPLDMSHVDFCLYSTTSRGDDIHYFFSSNIKEIGADVHLLKGIHKNGYGTGKLMVDN